MVFRNIQLVFSKYYCNNNSASSPSQSPSQHVAVDHEQSKILLPRSETEVPQVSSALQPTA